MENPSPSAGGGRLLLHIARAALGKLALGFLLPAVIFAPLPVFSAADAEPLYYIYRGQPKQLTLDPAHIAVHVRANSGDPLPAGLTSRGFSTADVESHPLPEWMVLRQPSTVGATGAKSQAIHSTRARAAAVHELIRTLSGTGDPAIDFVSPVFRDAGGNPVLVTSRVLIGFKQGVPASTRTQLQSTVSAGAFTEQSAYPQRDHERWQIRTADGFAVLAAANSLAQSPDVAYAEPDLIISGHHDLTPTDPSFSTSWALQNSGLSGGQTGFDLNAVLAWDTTIGSPSVIVVILDVGIQQDHPDLNQIPGRDFTTDANQNPNGGPNGAHDNHGTWVAGCVSERINNGLGTCGLAPGARVASARVGTNVTSDGHFTLQFSWVVDALNWAQSIGARVTNNSNSYSESSSAIDAAYTSTHDAGMVHFAAAGNDGSAVIDYPGSSSSVNSVASLNRNGFASGFTNYGQGLKFAAPGEEILTTDRTGRASQPGDYAVVSGTSFASPYTAAVAALIISVHPDWTAIQVEQQMQRTCRDLGTPGYDTTFGYGMPDAFKAVTTIAPPPTPTPTVTPTPSPTAPPVPTPTPTSTVSPVPTATPIPTTSPLPTVTPTPSALPSPVPIDPDDVLVTVANPIGAPLLPGEVNTVREFHRDGTFVQSFQFTYGGNAYPQYEFLRGITVDQEGQIDAFNGSDPPYLSRFNPASNSFTHVTFPGWNILNGATQGSITAYHQFVFVLDGNQSGFGAPSTAYGIIRYDTTTGEAVRFADTTQFIDLDMGFDGALYAMVQGAIMPEWPTGIQVYDPVTLQLLRTIPLSLDGDDVRAMAAAPDGRVFIASFRYSYIQAVDQQGRTAGFQAVPQAVNIADMDIAADGRIVLTTMFGQILLGDTSLQQEFTGFRAVSDSTIGTISTHVAFASATDTLNPLPTPPPTPTPYGLYLTETVTGQEIIPAATDIGLHCAECATPVIVPFEIAFFYQVLPAGSSVNVSTNGIMFGSGSGNPDCLPATDYDLLIAPAWDHFTTALDPSDGVFSSVTGVAPNRIFIIEWRVRYLDGSPMNFEVLFYEGRKRIEFIYGPGETRHVPSEGLQIQRPLLLDQTFLCGALYQPGEKVSWTEILVKPEPLLVDSMNRFSGQIATFFASRAGAMPADFSAQIDWGDGTVEPATISGSPRLEPLKVNASHQYQSSAHPAATIRITDLVEKNYDTGLSVAPTLPPTPSPTPTPTATPIPPPVPTPPPAPPSVSVFASPGSVPEGDTGQFTISLSSVNPSQPTVVSFSLTGKAQEGVDYTTDNLGQVTIPAGVSSGVVTINALTDTARERSEKITLTLLEGTNYNLPRIKSQRKATMTIINVGGTGR